MASTYSSRLRFEKQGSGENDATWGDKVNVVFDLIDDAISGLVSISVNGGTTVLTVVNSATDQARMAILKFTGTLLSNETIQASGVSKWYMIWNATSGDFTLKIEVSGGTAVTITQGSKVLVFTDGTDFYAFSYDTQAAGTDVASASTIDLTAESARVFVVTGTTEVTAVTMNQGQLALVIADGALPLKYHATTNKINTGGVDHTLTAGDRVHYYKDNDDVIHGDIIKNSGLPVLGSNHSNDFRLTLETGVPCSTSDQTGKTTLYATPYTGDKIDIYDGSSWITFTSVEMSVAVPSTTVTPYDIFIYDNAGTPTLEALDWTNDTTRATGITYQNGIYCKTGALTRRYLGTCRTTSVSGQSEDSIANRYLYNYYHRKWREGQGTFSADRTTSSSSFTEINTEIRCEFVLGVIEDLVHASVNGSMADTANTVFTGIAFDSTTVPETGLTVGSFESFASGQPMPIGLSGPVSGLAVGFHYATVLGKTGASGTSTWFSSDGNVKAKCYLQLELKM